MRVEVIGVPLGLGACAAGPEGGPAALRAAGLPAALAARGHEVTDRGDLASPRLAQSPPGDPALRHLDPIARVAARLADATAAAVARGSFPLVLGGDHSVALGSIRGAARGRQLGVVWIDAHADFNTAETSPSGNIHGMPLAALLGLGDPRLVGIDGARGGAIAPEHVALLGVRSIDAGERELLAGSGVTLIAMADIARVGVAAAAALAIAVASRAAGGIYVSLDADAIDPRWAPGVTTPVPGGLSAADARLACALLCASRRLVGMDVVELDPTRDEAGQTAQLVVELVRAVAGEARPAEAGRGRPW
jgi:arginase